VRVTWSCSSTATWACELRSRRPCTQICFFHLRRLRQVRGLLRRQVAAQLVSAFITSRLEYGNATLSGLPQSTLAPNEFWMQPHVLSALQRSASTRTCNQCTNRFTLACCTYRIQDMRASVPVTEQYCTSIHFRHAAASLFTWTSNQSALCDKFWTLCTAYSSSSWWKSFQFSSPPLAYGMLYLQTSSELPLY